jgi:hypothetical protein
MLQKRLRDEDYLARNCTPINASSAALPYPAMIVSWYSHESVSRTTSEIADVRDAHHMDEVKRVTVSGVLRKRR